MIKLWRDMRFGLRMLARNKGFTAIAILALALGIGPNVAIFSIVWATFLSPLPYPHSDQLVVAWKHYRGQRNGVPAEIYAEYAAQSHSFQILGFTSWTTLHFTGADHSVEEVAGRANTPGSITKLLGLPMALGRDFLPGEGTPGNDHVVLLTHSLWETHFHADPSILGKPILIEDQPYTVVGVIPAGPLDRIPGTQFTVPMSPQPGVTSNEWGDIIGRLSPGVTREQAQAELSIIDHRVEERRHGATEAKNWSMSVEPLHNDWLDHKLERNLWLLLAAVGLVLLIACANVANLLLARGAARQQELALRSALGATRRQIFAQLLTESLTLSILGGAIGLGLGWGIMKLSMAILPLVRQTAEAVVQVDVPVLCFAIGLSVLGGILFGCAPAWQAAGVNLSETLKQGSRSISGRDRNHTQGILVTAEFALALTLLAGAGMALHSFWNLSRIDLGITPEHVLTADLQRRSISRNQRDATPPPEEIIARQRALIDKLGSIPGVENAVLATNMPLRGFDSFPFAVAGHPADPQHPPVADLQAVTPGFFATFGIRLLRGRFLNDSDVQSAPLAVIVNESFVRRYLGGMDPLQQRLLIALPGSGENHPGAIVPFEIVGIYHDVLDNNHLTGATQPAIYVSMWQVPVPYFSIAVRTALDPGSVSSGMRAAVAQAEPNTTVADLQTMNEVVESQLTSDRFGMVLFGSFAGIALLLAALGIYGVMSFAVAQRTHEMGLRMALGAQKSDVVAMVVRGGIRLALPGMALGLIGAFALGQLMHSTLYGVGSVDFLSTLLVAALLLAVAVFACWLPARRSAQVDPMIALREQ
ncbi:putative ABC transport system permease protein [Silvibacterium bohemicum]|uniref:Putative ABC transport system permease protein n=1 Tax=Silvibacterium bohemicum TaxID=1577686 RepID=A0A841JV20_9BACT|nr:ABC transporter permease [Silvibacterium bohemicum]MBB6142278.1 putative ABC transport system permease protein [Silvibacterium bohemicum]